MQTLYQTIIDEHIEALRDSLNVKEKKESSFVESPHILLVDFIKKEGSKYLHNPLNPTICDTINAFENYTFQISDEQLRLQHRTVLQLLKNAYQHYESLFLSLCFQGRMEHHERNFPGNTKDLLRGITFFTMYSHPATVQKLRNNFDVKLHILRATERGLRGQSTVTPNQLRSLLNPVEFEKYRIRVQSQIQSTASNCEKLVYIWKTLDKSDSVGALRNLCSEWQGKVAAFIETSQEPCIRMYNQLATMKPRIQFSVDMRASILNGLEAKVEEWLKFIQHPSKPSVKEVADRVQEQQRFLNNILKTEFASCLKEEADVYNNFNDLERLRGKWKSTAEAQVYKLSIEITKSKFVKNALLSFHAYMTSHQKRQSDAQLFSGPDSELLQRLLIHNRIADTHADAASQCDEKEATETLLKWIESAIKVDVTSHMLLFGVNLGQICTVSRSTTPLEFAMQQKSVLPSVAKDGACSTFLEQLRVKMENQVILDCEAPGSVMRNVMDSSRCFVDLYRDMGVEKVTTSVRERESACEVYFKEIEKMGEWSVKEIEGYDKKVRIGTKSASFEKLRDNWKSDILQTVQTLEIASIREKCIFPESKLELFMMHIRNAKDEGTRLLDSCGIDISLRDLARFATIYTGASRLLHSINS